MTQPVIVAVKLRMGFGLKVVSLGMVMGFGAVALIAHVRIMVRLSPRSTNQDC